MTIRSFLKAPHPATLDPSHPRYVTGTVEEQRQARADWFRARYINEVMRSKLVEIPRSSLRPAQRHWLEDTETGEFYVPRRDGLVDLAYTPNAVAYFVDASGLPVLLERPHAPSPQTRAELEQRQAEREQRRNAPKPRRMEPPRR